MLIFVSSERGKTRDRFGFGSGPGSGALALPLSLSLPYQQVEGQYKFVFRQQERAIWQRGVFYAAQRG